MKMLILSQFLLKIINLSQKIMKMLILSQFLSKISNLNQKTMKILILSQFSSKIEKKYENHAATQRDAARRSATPTGDFATQRDADWRFRDAARRQEIS